MFRFPFGTTQELNLDWFLEQWEIFKQEAQTAFEGIDHALDDEIQRVEDAMTNLYAARDAAIAAKNDALDYAQSANSSAIGASQSAQNSAASAVTSAQQAQSAAQQAQNAAQSAISAQGSATNAGTSAGNALTQAQQSEAWATGEIGGVHVPPSAPQNLHNAKQYATNAQLSANAANTAKNDARVYSQDSKAWATGIRNGQPVTSEDETYQNNAKYYAESISGDAAAAAQSASDAAASAESVSASATQIATNTDNIRELQTVVEKIMKPGKYDLSGETLYNWTINNSGNWVSWTDQELSRSYVIPCKYADSVNITGNATNGSIIAFLKSFTPVNGEPADFSTEYPARITLTQGENKRFIIPNDAIYMFILATNSAGNDYTPNLLFYYNDPYVLPSTNDTTDRSAEVEAILKQFGICKFEKGKYYVKNVQMPDNSTIEGVGAGSEIIVEDFSLPDNMWTYGNQTFTRAFAKTLDNPLPPGKYTFTATAISSDTDSDKCRINFYYADDSYAYIQISRETPQTVTIQVEQPVVRIMLCASNTIGNSSGDTATYTNISLYVIPRTVAFITGSKCAIRNLAFIGSLSDITINSDGLRNAITYRGIGNNTPEKRGIISNCFFHNFTGGCIYFINTGNGIDSGYNIDNCYMWNSYAGIEINRLSEFHRVNNCSITDCYYGVINNGGNNTFSNCNISRNSYGFAIDASDGDRPNSAHGNVVGCIIQHSRIRAVYINNTAAGFIFSGCNIDNGGIEIINSARIIFNAINFMFDSPIVITGTYPSETGTVSLIMFNSCNMRITEANTYTESGNPVVKFINCFTEDGTPVDPTTP